MTYDADTTYLSHGISLRSSLRTITSGSRGNCRRGDWLNQHLFHGSGKEGQSPQTVDIYVCTTKVLKRFGGEGGRGVGDEHILNFRFFIVILSHLGQQMVNRCIRRNMYWVKYGPIILQLLSTHMVNGCDRLNMYWIKYGPIVTIVDTCDRKMHYTKNVLIKVWAYHIAIIVDAYGQWMQ